YWCAAYRALLEAAQHERVHLVGFEALGERRGLEPLAGAAGVDPSELRAHAEILSEAPAREVNTSSLPADVLEAAASLHEQLRARCLLAR
ncbi:MAG: hypothetical protein VXY92_13245, partial [Planctomycetota bacterium]|nr:hypothetical protein [Planctomycetota bacterium]